MNARCLLPLVLVTVTGCKFAPDTRPEVKANAAVVSQYLFRGVPQVDKPVVMGDLEASVENESGGRYTFGGWGNLEISRTTGSAVFPDGNEGTITEINGWGYYSRSTESLDYSVGAIHYAYPSNARISTNEVFLRLAGDWSGIIPSVTGYYDIDDINGTYVDAGFDTTHEVSDDFSIDTGLHIGISDTDHSLLYYGVSESGLADLFGTLSFNWSIDAHRRFSLFGRISTIVDPDLEDALDLADLDSQNLYGGISYGWVF